MLPVTDEVGAPRRPRWDAAVRHGLSTSDQELVLPSGGQEDFDAFRDDLNAAYYPAVVDTSARDRGLQGGRLSVRRLPHLTLGFARFGRDVLVDPGYIDGYHVNVPLAGWVRSEGGEQSVLARPGTAAVFSASQRTRLPLWHGNAAQLCVKIDRSLVEQEAASLLGRASPVAIRFALSLPLGSGQGYGWFHSLAEMIDALDDAQTPARALEYMERALVVRLLYAAEHDRSDELRTAGAGVPRPRMLEQLLEIIDDGSRRLLTVGDLAAAARVSVRRVEQVFRDHLGVSPTAYMMQRRLDWAHHDLSNPAPNESVTAVMYRCGFGNPARFAAAYRERFGVRPSEVLRRAR